MRIESKRFGRGENKNDFSLVCCLLIFYSKQRNIASWLYCLARITPWVFVASDMCWQQNYWVCSHLSLCLNDSSHQYVVVVVVLAIFKPLGGMQALRQWYDKGIDSFNVSSKFQTKNSTSLNYFSFVFSIHLMLQLESN